MKCSQTNDSPSHAASPESGTLATVAHAMAQPWVICDESLTLIEASDNWLFAYGLADGPTSTDLCELLPSTHVQSMLDCIAHLEDHSRVCDPLLAPFDNELRDFRFLLSGQRLAPQNDSQLDSATDPQSTSDASTTHVSRAQHSSPHYLLTLREISVGLSLDELRRDRRQRDGLLRALVHDLQSPMSAARNAIDLLRYATRDDNVLEILELLESCVERSQQYVRDFSEFALMNPEEVQRNRETIEVESFLETAVDVYRLQGLPHPFHVDVDPQCWVALDVPRFTRVVDNLLGNAVKYSPGGGDITVRARQSVHGELVISVEDHGIGIRAESLKKVWEPFYRATQLRDGESGGEIDGTGLGLAVVKHVVQLHGGRVSSTSTVGQGSCFSVILPSNCVVIESPESHSTEEVDATPDRAIDPTA